MGHFFHSKIRVLSEENFIFEFFLIEIFFDPSIKFLNIKCINKGQKTHLLCKKNWKFELGNQKK